MARKVEIRANLANLLTYIGRLYRNPADALKEYVSNALDEWQKGPNTQPCRVDYFLERNRITIACNQPGMDEKAFRDALQRVADSAKPGLGLPQIGQLGIGIFAFNQVGSKCTFLSKPAERGSTTKVILRSNSDEAEFETAPHREALQEPGMKICIEQLLHDPLKPRGPLGTDRLRNFFADKFDSYLREGLLEITIHVNGDTYAVKPRNIVLRPIGQGFTEVRLRRDPQKFFSCALWFDPQGKSSVSIRHMKIPIIEDLKNVQAYGLEESIFASGYLKGYIDADFLKPQPARTSFVEDTDWINFLDELDTIRPSLEKEVEQLRKEQEQERLSEVQRKAIDLAQEILNSEEFQDLALLGGLRIPRGPRKRDGRTRKKGGESKGGSGGGKSKGGPRINLSEVPFTDEKPPHKLHSRFIGGQVQINKLNLDYQREMSASESEKLAYATLMIGKETIGYNDSSNAANEYLEKFASFLFQVKSRVRAG